MNNIVYTHKMEWNGTIGVLDRGKQAAARARTTATTVGGRTAREEGRYWQLTDDDAVSAAAAAAAWHRTATAGLSHSLQCYVIQRQWWFILGPLKATVTIGAALLGKTHVSLTAGATRRELVQNHMDEEVGCSFIHCQKRNCVRNHNSININIILLYGILQITVLFDMCAAFALGALHNFQIWYGAAREARAQGAASPRPCPLWRRPCRLLVTYWRLVCV